MTITTQENSIRYHLSCIGVILEKRADNVLHEYQQLIIGLILGFLLCMAVLLPTVINTPYEPQEPITTSVPLANSDVDLLDTELSGERGSYNFTGRFIANNTSVNAFECSVDGQKFESCETPVTVVGSQGGEHTFEVRSVLPNGTVDNTPAVDVWGVK